MDTDVLLWLNPHVALSTGKAAAQVGHAAQLVYESMSRPAATSWAAAGAPLDVSVADEADWDRLVATLPVVVTDGGFTEVPPGTITVVADRP
jgi:peptidyl-tRNA hydrolase